MNNSFNLDFLRCFTMHLVNDLKGRQNLTRRVGNRASRMEFGDERLEQCRS